MTAQYFETTLDNRMIYDGFNLQEFDAEGNPIKEFSFQGVTEYTWDHLNRLTKIITKDGTETITTGVIEYTYDALGRRIQKQVDTSPHDSFFETDERFAYDRDRLDSRLFCDRTRPPPRKRPVH